jgi:hypothetical protein
MRAIMAHWTLPDVRWFLFDGAALSAVDRRSLTPSGKRPGLRRGRLWHLAHPRASQPGLAGTAGLRPLEYPGLEIFFGRGRQAARHDPFAVVPGPMIRYRKTA